MPDPEAFSTYVHGLTADTPLTTDEMCVVHTSGPTAKKATIAQILALGGGTGPTISQNAIYLRNNPSNPLTDFNFAGNCDPADSPLLVAVVLQNTNGAAPSGWTVWNTAGNIRVYTRVPDGTSGDYMNCITTGGGSALLAAMWEFHHLQIGAYAWSANTSPSSGILPTLTLTKPSYVVAVIDGVGGTMYGPSGWGPGVQGDPYGGRKGGITVSPAPLAVRASAIGVGSWQGSNGSPVTNVVFAVG